MIHTINIPDFIKWALTQKGYSMHEGKLTFFRFYFARLEKEIQNKQFKLFNKEKL
jgi:hypothetical protein